MGIVCFPFPGDWNHFSPPNAQNISPSERQKIEALIKYVSGLSDTKFVRDGNTYDAKTATTFLRRKWEANDSEVKTARDFIDKIATLSGTSGKPYIIRFKDTNMQIRKTIESGLAGKPTAIELVVTAQRVGKQLEEEIDRAQRDNVQFLYRQAR